MDLSGFSAKGTFRVKDLGGVYVSIKCNNLKEVEDVLDELDKANCVWADNQPLSENREHLKYFPIYLNRRVFTVTFSNYAVHEEMTYAEFMKKRLGEESKRLTILHNAGDKKVTATDEKGNVAEAKCHPDDEFNFSTGARIALNRLLEGLTTDRNISLGVGDKVKFKDKEDVYSYADKWMDQWARDSWKMKYAWASPIVLGTEDILESTIVRIAPHWVDKTRRLALVKVCYKGSDIPTYYLTSITNLERI